MTRLDPNNEPSMEDILASIRKIIAEDPPGSRPIPAPAQRSSPAPSSFAAKMAFGRNGMQEPHFQSSAVPAPAEVTPEPYLRPAPAKPESPSFASSPFFTAKSEPDSAAERIEPSFSPAAADVAPIEAPSPEPASLSVEEQLSELLGEVAPAEPAAAATPAELQPVPDAGPQKPEPSIDFAAKLMGRPGPSATLDNGLDRDPITPQPEARSGFTVSRDGYVPAEIGSQKERDPFDFDLGPSPFEAKAVPTFSAPRRGFIPTDRTDPGSSGFFPRTSMNVGNQVVAGSPEPALEASKSLLETPHVAPSVEATLLPGMATPGDNSGTATLAEPAAAERMTESTSDNMGFSAAVATADYENAVPSGLFEEHADDDLHYTAISLPAPAARTMEDTVAELLRPMLKSWLAENMPKIVERALRRELSEQLLSDHKTAAE